MSVDELRLAILQKESFKIGFPITKLSSVYMQIQCSFGPIAPYFKILKKDSFR